MEKVVAVLIYLFAACKVGEAGNGLSGPTQNGSVVLWRPVALTDIALFMQLKLLFPLIGVIRFKA